MPWIYKGELIKDENTKDYYFVVENSVNHIFSEICITEIRLAENKVIFIYITDQSLSVQIENKEFGKFLELMKSKKIPQYINSNNGTVNHTIVANTDSKFAEAVLVVINQIEPFEKELERISTLTGISMGSITRPATKRNFDNVSSEIDSNNNNNNNNSKRIKTDIVATVKENPLEKIKLESEDVIKFYNTVIVAFRGDLGKLVFPATELKYMLDKFPILLRQLYDNETTPFAQILVHQIKHFCSFLEKNDLFGKVDASKELMQRIADDILTGGKELKPVIDEDLIYQLSEKVYIQTNNKQNLPEKQSQLDTNLLEMNFRPLYDEAYEDEQSGRIDSAIKKYKDLANNIASINPGYSEQLLLDDCHRRLIEIYEDEAIDLRNQLLSNQDLKNDNDFLSHCIKINNDIIELNSKIKHRNVQDDYGLIDCYIAKARYYSLRREFAPAIIEHMTALTMLHQLRFKYPTDITSESYKSFNEGLNKANSNYFAVKFPDVDPNFKNIILIKNPNNPQEIVNIKLENNIFETIDMILSNETNPNKIDICNRAKSYCLFYLGAHLLQLRNDTDDIAIKNMYLKIATKKIYDAIDILNKLHTQLFTDFQSLIKYHRILLNIYAQQINTDIKIFTETDNLLKTRDKLLDCQPLHDDEREYFLTFCNDICTYFANSLYLNASLVKDLAKSAVEQDRKMAKYQDAHNVFYGCFCILVSNLKPFKSIDYKMLCNLYSYYRELLDTSQLRNSISQPIRKTNYASLIQQYDDELKILEPLKNKLFFISTEDQGTVEIDVFQVLRKLFLSEKADLLRFICDRLISDNMLEIAIEYLYESKSIYLILKAIEPSPSDSLVNKIELSKGGPELQIDEKIALVDETLAQYNFTTAWSPHMFARNNSFVENQTSSTDHQPDVNNQPNL